MFHPSDKDAYDTQAGRKDLLSGLLLNCRFYFYSRIYFNFYRIARCAARGRFDRENQARYSGRNVDILERCGARLHLRGLNHLTGIPGPFVLAGNHMSSIETVIFNAFLSPRLDFTFVIKQELFSVPFFRRAMRAIDAIGVGQRNPREDFATVMREGVERLNAGRSVLIFPEAARYREFRAERFNTIAVKLARAAGVPIIPFALKTDFITPGRFLRECGPLHPENQIHVEFGSPLTVSGNGRKEQETIVRFIEERTRSWAASGRSAGPERVAPSPVNCC